MGRHKVYYQGVHKIMNDKIKIIESIRSEYRSNSVHEQPAYMDIKKSTLVKYDIDPWLILCSDAHWNYLKKIETVEHFTN